MKKILIIFSLLLIYNISSAQTGWGYVNYTSYKTHNGTGATNQYGAFPNNATEFDNMLNTANSNTTITHTGEVPISYMYNGSLQTPHWASDYYAIKFDFWFIPQQTGMYYFGINSDDASDLSIDGNILVTYYGGHGASSMQVVGKNMVAGQRYKIVVRYQEYGGGDVLYFQWYRPVGGWGYWNNEVTNVNSVPSKQVKMNFDFGGTLDKTKLSVGGTALTATGTVDVTSLIDSTKTNTGNKALTVGGQVEWCVIYGYDVTNNRYRIGIDSRQMSVTASTVNQLKLFDLWDGPVTFSSYDPNGWSEYFINTTTQFNFTNSTFASHIRDGGSYHALTADFSYIPTQSYKPQSVKMTTTNTFSTMYNSIMTVSDVYLAFKELANGGIFGNQTGNEFTYGVQFKNADVNDDGVFNEADTYRMLQHLTGIKNIVDTFTFPKLLKLIPTTLYNNISKSNWNTSSSYLGDIYNFDINTGKSVDTLNVSGTWKGDVNLSHSATPASNGITTMSVKTMNVVSTNNVEADIMLEKTGDDVVATIKLNTHGNQIGATQFEVYFDNTLLTYNETTFNLNNSTNFKRNNISSISVGTLNTSGQSIGNMEYKVFFKCKNPIVNILGLITIENVETIDINSNKLKINII